MTTLWPSADLLSKVSDHQRERYALASASPIGILGGNPGAGKTHTTGRIIKCVVDEHGPASVAVCAPTGKAAIRITEVMLAADIPLDHPATTIHRLLGVQRNGHDGKGWGFLHNAAQPLRTRFIFIDETSMLETSLLSSLLSACSAGTHLMFIGDFAQLPPVGHGAPLRDMIAAGLPYGELTEIHRNGGDIVTACQAVKEGRRFQPSPYIDIPGGRNFLHIEAARPTFAVGALSRMLKNPPAGVDPVWDVQVLCAVNEKSDVGRANLNKIMQGILNPDGARVDGNKFRVDDKVICTTNGMLAMAHCPICSVGDDGQKRDGDPPAAAWDGKLYQCTSCGRAWAPKDCCTDFVANGEMGRVLEVFKGWMHVGFDSPKRTIRVAGEWLSEFDLAFAITCHRAQGSEWPFVIAMADDSNGADMVTSREWWYTAYSRPRKLLTTIGKMATMERQCKKAALSERQTFLAKMLAGVA